MTDDENGDNLHLRKALSVGIAFEDWALAFRFCEIVNRAFDYSCEIMPNGTIWEVRATD